MTRKICVVTGSRAEFGLLRNLMDEISTMEGLRLQIIATCMHLSTEYGLTYREILDAGFKISYEVEMLLGANTPTAVSKSIGLGMIGFADAFKLLKPDMLVVLGDRFELISAVTAALIAGIPIAHIHGGEITEAAIDDSIRHAVTKMSHLHFVSTSEYAQRVRQLGEPSDRIFVTGGLGVDAIRKMSLYSLDALENELKFKFAKKNLLITFHPVTLQLNETISQFKELLHALAQFDGVNLIFTMPNADAGSHEIQEILKNFVINRKNCILYQSLGHRRYLSCMQFVDGVVGNSSSGLLEAPTFGIGTVNIGDRQKGRISAASVIHCKPVQDEIYSAIQKLFDEEFKAKIRYVENPYGSGGASHKIALVLKSFPLENLMKKEFFNLINFS